ncbi:hypothetical protein [Belnapia rosea]|uniref:hypothetical protein n=1 Tax=Belnapia rosea TaxID=938405 RepID=UPI000881EF3A|nr:hypothetical protein [Belnapia rosea]SDB17463.1 hypothetical protein SAMN02927895_00633 [Belnapia rosea]
MATLWLKQRHGSKRRRAWRVLHLVTDANTGRIIASTLTDRDADDGSRIGRLLDQATEAAIAAEMLNRMVELGRLKHVRTA